MHHIGRHCTISGSIALATIQCNAPPSSALLLQLVQRSPKWRNASESQAPPRFAQQLPHWALHLLRDATPDQNGCIAYVSGAARTLTSTTADTTAWHHPHHHQFRMQFPGDHTLQHPKNRRIPTFSFQKLKHLQGNCMRNFGDATERALSSPPATPPSRSRAANKPPPSGCGGHSAHCDAQRPSR